MIRFILLVLGILILINPQLLKYVEIDYFKAYDFLNDNPNYRFPAGIILLALAVALFVNEYGKHVYCIYSKNVVQNMPKLPWHYKQDEKQLNTTPITKDIINVALKETNEFFEEIKNNKEKKFYFFAICDIPFIVKLGYLIGDATYEINYLHYYRNKQKYKKLGIGRNTLKFNNEYIDNNSDELFVIIESSFKVVFSEINDKFKKMNILTINTSLIDVDSINNRNKLLEFADYCINTIREYSPNMKNIHITMSTSSSFAFAFGQKISNSMDKEMIIYNYLNSNKLNNRPWGLRINCRNDKEDCVVIDKKALNEK